MDFFERLMLTGICFNNNQIEAIIHIDGPILVVAGPGSGKTSVITARTAYLIEKASIKPEDIVVITYTKNAANEMRRRFVNLAGGKTSQYERVNFGTVHSLFYRIICAYYGRYLKVLDVSKAHYILKNILLEIHAPHDNETTNNILNEISLARFYAQRLSSFKSDYLTSSKFLQIYNIYQEQKDNLKLIDFDDMIIMCKNILESDNTALESFRQKYKYILVDEFQDTSKSQFDILKLLAFPLNNICAVGDDDQSIYGFRGAKPECFTEFSQQYDPCKTVVLDTNYRSTKEIIDLSAKVIAYNVKRIEKKLLSVKGCGKKPVVIFPSDQKEEANFIADTIESSAKHQYSYRDFAVLYRTNMQSRSIIDELLSRKIPFNIKDTTESFFEHWICKDITCYLKLSLDPDEISSFFQIVNRPSRYIDRSTLKDIQTKFKHSEASLYEFLKSCRLMDSQIQNILTLYKNLDMLKSISPISAVRFIRETIGYDRYIRNYCLQSSMECDVFFDILNEYEISSSNFNTTIEFLNHIKTVKLMFKNVSYPKKDCVTLTTIHSAKGLEFPNVFVIDAIEDILPHKRSIKTGENIEEERRLFYVAITRCMYNLYISSPKSYHGKSANISRFLLESLLKSKANYDKINYVDKFIIGQLIRHKYFGTGKILDINNTTIDIRFNCSSETKQLDLRTCIEKRLFEK